METTKDCLTPEAIERLESHFEWEELDRQCHGTECTLNVGTGDAPFVAFHTARLDPRRRPVQYLALKPGKKAATTRISGQDYDIDIAAEANAPFGVVVAALAAAAFKGQCGPMDVWTALREADHRFDPSWPHYEARGPRLHGLPANFEVRDL